MLLAWNTIGYFDELFDGFSCNSPDWCDPTTGTPVAVTVGSTTTGIDFQLDPGGLITGTVTDATTGDPVPGVRVMIVDQNGQYATQGDTDELGSFSTYGGLPDDTYYAKTTAWGYYLDELWEEIPCTGWSCDVTTGTPIIISGASTASGIDFTLTPGAGLISGQVTDEATGDPIIDDCLVNIFADDGSWVTNGCTDNEGRYTNDGGLPPGNYFLISSNSYGYVDELYADIQCPGGGCHPTTGTPITVVADTTTTIDFALGTLLEEIFSDDFEGGDTSAWSVTFP